MNANDIAKQLAAKFSGLSIKKDEPPPPPEPVYQPVLRNPGAGSKSGGSLGGGTKLWPSERMTLGNVKKPAPARAPVRLNDFTEDELDWMFDTPAKKQWEFSDWCEVIGLPRDLHEEHDGVIYTYAAKNFLRHKRACY